jgi:hypothetical protein
MAEATDEQRRAAETKRLVFSNLVNGVPPPVVAETFHLSIDEVQREFIDVLHKIKCYMRERNIVGFDQLEVLAHARRDKVVVLHALSRLGPVYLTSPPKYRRIPVQQIDEAFVQKELNDGFLQGFGR